MYLVLARYSPNSIPCDLSYIGMLSAPLHPQFGRGLSSISRQHGDIKISPLISDRELVLEPQENVSCPSAHGDYACVDHFRAFHLTVRLSSAPSGVIFPLLHYKRYQIIRSERIRRFPCPLSGRCFFFSLGSFDPTHHQSPWPIFGKSPSHILQSIITVILSFKSHIVMLSNSTGSFLRRGEQP